MPITASINRHPEAERDVRSTVAFISSGCGIGAIY